MTSESLTNRILQNVNIVSSDEFHHIETLEILKTNLQRMVHRMHNEKKDILLIQNHFKYLTIQLTQPKLLEFLGVNNIIQYLNLFI